MWIRFITCAQHSMPIFSDGHSDGHCSDNYQMSRGPVNTVLQPLTKSKVETNQLQDCFYTLSTCKYVWKYPENKLRNRFAAS